mmetsp:Transcript_3276/g.7817  ORF Transcript_3276/g.7817 Transcript_3276/m.7817 type:complete len:92 (+) Transcript_3276:754-1029(+)
MPSDSRSLEHCAGLDCGDVSSELRPAARLAEAGVKVLSSRSAARKQHGLVLEPHSHPSGTAAGRWTTCGAQGAGNAVAGRNADEESRTTTN